MTIPFPPLRESGLRFRSRHAHKTVAEFVKVRLTDLGWVNDPVNFNEQPVTFKEVQPDENGLVVAPNTVSITAGDLSEVFEEQLGGGLYRLVLPVFIDVFGSTSSTAVSIAEDVREQLSYGTTLPMLDWDDVQHPVVTDGYIDLENTIGPDRPQASQVSADFRRFWRVVKTEAHVHYGS